MAIVGLDDVSKIDVPSARIAETKTDGIRGLVDRIPFCMTVEEELLITESYALVGEIHCSGEGALKRGDYLTTIAFPWSIGDCRDKVINVTQI